MEGFRLRRKGGVTRFAQRPGMESAPATPGWIWIPANAVSPTGCHCRYWTGYNNNYQLFQSRDYVVILAEMFRDRRIIPLDGRSHGNVPQWLGDARGRWEGDTLVVETTRFADKAHYWWASAWRASRPAIAPDGTLHACRRRNDRLPVHDGRPGDVHAAVDGGISADDESGVTRRDGGSAVPVRVSRGELRSPERPGWSPDEGQRRRKRRAEGVEVMHARLIGTIACALLAATALPGCQARPAASSEAASEKGAPPRTARRQAGSGRAMGLRDHYVPGTAE